MPYKFKKPEEDTSNFPAYIQAKLDYAKSINSEYVLSDDEKAHIEFLKLKASFPDTLTTFVAALRKVKYDVPGTETKDWFVYKIIEEVKDINKRSHIHEQWHGFRTEPVADVTTNQVKEVTDSRVDKERIIFEVPFSRVEVQKVLDIDTRVNTPSNICIGEGTDYGVDTVDPIRGNPLSVFNLEEFIQFKYDYLEGANKGGYLVASYGGMLDFLDKMNIPVEEAMYPGEKVPEAMLNPEFRHAAATTTSNKKLSIQDQKAKLRTAEYKQTVEQQKAQQ